MIRLILLFALLAPHLSPQDFRVRRVARAASGGMELIGSAIASNWTNNPSVSLTVTSGNTVVGYVLTRLNTITFSSFTSSCGTITPKHNPTTGPDSAYAIFYGRVTSTGSCTFSASMSATNRGIMFVAEFSGGHATDILDNDQSAVDSGTGSTHTTPSITTVTDGAAVVSFLLENSTNLSASTTPSGYTNIASAYGDPYAYHAVYQIKETAGSVSASFTSVAPTWATIHRVIVALKPE